MAADLAGTRAARCNFPLFVPGDRPDRLARAIAAARDCVIADLEDAVAPAARQQARDLLAGEAALLGGAAVPVFVRVNGVGTPWHEDDIALCARLPIAGVMLPKADGAAAIASLRSRLPGREILALVETAAGLADLRVWARNADRIAFGAIDYSADLGCAEEPMALLGARSEIVLASRLAGLPAPLDGVTTSVRDADRIRQDAPWLRRKVDNPPGPVRTGDRGLRAERAAAPMGREGACRGAGRGERHGRTDDRCAGRRAGARDPGACRGAMTAVADVRARRQGVGALAALTGKARQGKTALSKMLGRSSARRYRSGSRGGNSILPRPGNA